MERLRSWLPEALAAGVAGVAGSYALAGFTQAFVAGSLASTVARVTPGIVVTAAITTLGDAGKLLTVAGGFAVAVALFATIALAARAAGDAVESTALPPMLAGTAAFGASTLLTGALAPALAAGAAVGATLVVVPLAARVGGDAPDPGRRRVLGAVGTALAAAGVAYPLGRRRTPGAVADDPPSDPEVRSLLAEASAKSLDVDGLEPLVSDEFYEVDINAADPTLDADEWTLSVTGAVDEDLELDYDEVTAMESREVFTTLRCVGESLNGRKMDTALWTAVPLRDVLERAGVGENCCVMLRAADGYYEEFPVAALREGMLAYRMNGDPLPRGHGYPVRALIPGHWGEINVKWLTEIEILAEPADGYWEKRGWHGTGPVNTVAKLHATARDGDRIEVAGHAYAGTRGISAVEVSTDGGDTWQEATLSEELPGKDVWRQWAYAYDSPGERHEVVVRAIEADGTVQPKERADAYPSGPTGWVSKELRG
ncbi:molybdopterin-dependent oxidoreductase [Halorarius halobius]|uniref:molybdopterin-dependent oxidoreductase n=1 Tax=Halorarius halobius TaxID=2962671 RepID=UPI0020CD6BCB|nr:molybdopterin-dependent oxidoreductase [Halorarius halobius]